MEAFCNGPLWNDTLLLDNTWPQFTDCFIHTILIWIPCSVLFLALPCYIWPLGEGTTPRVEIYKTRVFTARLSCCIALSLLCMVLMIIRILGLTISTSPAAYLADALYIVAYMALCLVARCERVNGVRMPAITFFFWLLVSLCNIIPLYTMIIQQGYVSHPTSFTVFLMAYCLQLCSLVLTALDNNQGFDQDKNSCPETTCSFPSYLTFWWMTRLMRAGYSRDLEEQDMWQLPPCERSSHLAARFNILWLKEQRACQAIQRNQSKKERFRSTSQETSPLLQHQLEGETTSSPSHDGEEITTNRSPRLMRTLVRMMAMDFCVIFLQKIASDLLFLMSPLLLGVLMTYMKREPAERGWAGYVLCLAMFGALILKSLLFAHSMFRAARVGIRMKSTLVAAIYNKALTMSNMTKSSATVGEIVNLMSVDVQRVQDVMIVCFYAATTPIQFLVAVSLLYFTIGPAIFVGVLLLVCCVPLNAYVISRQRILQSSNLHFKDARIRLFNEILSGIKMLKLYAWESCFLQKIREIRLKEVAALFKMAVLNTLMSLCWEMAPFLVTLVTFATYVLSNPNNHLDAGKAFVSLALFNVLRPPLTVLSKMVMYVILVQVSIKRIGKFLISDDLDVDAVERKQETEFVISIQDGTFTWNPSNGPVLQKINLDIKEGQLVAVVGVVGCGKSSLISAMLGEMEKVQGTVTSRGKIAYVPQQAWIQNATIRDNILFGKPFRKSEYRRVLRKCELERDLACLSAGDTTQVGEKGINLSGGQKQRVSMARAVYSDRDVYLLDDPLSAVDAHVGKAIFSNVIGPTGVLRRKTRVLVTHGVHWLPLVDEVIVMQDGKISERGSYDELVSHDGPFAQFLKTYLTEVFEVEEEEDPEIAAIHGKMRERLGSVTSYASSEDDSLGTRNCSSRRELLTKERSGCDTEDSGSVTTSTSDGEGELVAEPTAALTNPESVSKGKVKPSVFWYYASAVGVLPLLLAFASYCIFQTFSVGANFWLKKWTRHSLLLNTSAGVTGVTRYQEPAASTPSSASMWTDGSRPLQWNDTESERDMNHFYLAVYGILGIGQVIFLFAFNAVHWSRMASAARTLHASLADSLMHAPMSFFDTTPAGRVLNRLSYDVETVDNTLPLIIRDWLVTFSLVLVTLAVIVIHTPLSALVLLPLTVLYCICQKFYVPTARQLRRIECVTRTPIYVLFSETLNGAPSIRAYDVSQRFLEESKLRVDHNQVFFFAFQAAVRWMQWNLDVLSAIVVLATGVLTLANSSTGPGDAGLCISYALQISGTLTWMTRQICELETNIVSVERLKEYSELEKEADWIIPHKRPPQAWPTKGEVIFSNYQTRYRQGFELVLKGVTCTIRHGEKVGVVGRTGAGKSTLALSLFRLIEATGGSIYIDSLNIADMGLHDLRSRLNILPQEPVVFSGTLRMNLDPFAMYSDSQLWAALDRAHLRVFVNGLPGQLAFQCEEQGGNLSLGQRQLICLARTLLRNTKILVLDEATAAVDMETDALIQNTIRSDLRSCTVITIAHRLNTIMDYDKVLVMAGGQIEEYGPPGVLLAERTSAFFRMARDAGLV